MSRLPAPPTPQTAIYGNFSAPKVHEIVASRGQILDLLRPDENGRMQTICSTEVFGVIRALQPFRCARVWDWGWRGCRELRRAPLVRACMAGIRQDTRITGTGGLSRRSACRTLARRTVGGALPDACLPHGWQLEARPG